MSIRSPRAALALLLGAVAASAGAGCGADFDPYERLTSLRVLAIQSEPVAPVPGGMTTLSAFVYAPPVSEDDPTTPQPVTYKWEWCPFPGPANQGYPCPPNLMEQIAAMGGPTVILSLGTDPTATLQHNFDPALLAQLCQGIPGLPAAPSCDNGFPVQVKVTVSTATETVVAVRTVNLRLDDTAPPNHNPVLGDVHATVKDVDGLPVDALLDQTGTVTLQRRQDNQLQADVDIAEAETYDGLDDNGKPATGLTERLYISWFIETGDIKHPRTSYNKNATGGVTFDDLLKNKWTPERTKIYPRNTAALYVILRDSREGTTWKNYTVTLGDKP